MLGKLFISRPGDVFTAQNSHFGLVVGKLNAVHSGDETTIARAAEQVRPQMSQGFYREILESAHVAARQRIKPTIDVNRAREAIGLEPIDPKAQAAAGGKAPGKPPLAK
jgi:peptidyl-prolyl cis-trans isomerase D